MKLSKGLAAGTCLATAVLLSCGGSDPALDTAPASSARTLTAEQYYDKVHGGWLGSTVGGAFGMHFQRMHRTDIKPYLSDLGQWPLTDVRGAEELQIDDLARRTVEIGKMMTAAKSAGRVEITD